MPLAISQGSNVATVTPRGESPDRRRAGGICRKIGTAYVSRRGFLIIVFPDMNTRTEGGTEGDGGGGSGRRKAPDLLTRRVLLMKVSLSHSDKCAERESRAVG